MELSTRLGKFTFHAYSSPPLRIASQNTKNKHSNTKPERKFSKQLSFVQKTRPIKLGLTAFWTLPKQNDYITCGFYCQTTSKSSYDQDMVIILSQIQLNLAHGVFWSAVVAFVSGCHYNPGSVILGKCDVHETLKLCKANCKSGERGPKLFMLHFSAISTDNGDHDDHYPSHLIQLILNC